MEKGYIRSMDRESLRREALKSFNPNGIGLNNGRFIGLPFDEHMSELIIQSAPWDVTVSYRDGTHKGPENVIAASSQLDLQDSTFPNTWRKGIYVRPPSSIMIQESNKWREWTSQYIQALENAHNVSYYNAKLEECNQICSSINDSIYHDTKEILSRDKIPALLGGDHSTPYGLIKAVNEKYPDLGILQIDAHMDLRESYEGFVWSHASIFRNVMKHLHISKLIQVGIRDYCEEELDFVNSQGDKIKVFYDHYIQKQVFAGNSFSQISDEIIQPLPTEVHVSFDIDGLDPSLCPETGTPVPGGLSFQQAIYIIESIVKSGRRIVSFDLCEVGGTSSWDGNVGARILYKLACAALC